MWGMRASGNMSTSVEASPPEKECCINPQVSPSFRVLSKRSRVYCGLQEALKTPPGRRFVPKPFFQGPFVPRAGVLPSKNSRLTWPDFVLGPLPKCLPRSPNFPGQRALRCGFLGTNIPRSTLATQEDWAKPPVGKLFPRFLGPDPFQFQREVLDPRPAKHSPWLRLEQRPNHPETYSRKAWPGNSSQQQQTTSMLFH